MASDPKRWSRGGIEAADALARSFAACLADRVKIDHKQLSQDLDSRRATLEAQHSSWVVDEPARSNLRMLCVLLAARQMLAGRLPEAELLGVLRDCFTGQYKDLIRKGTSQWLDSVADPFTAIVELSKAKQVSAFGKGFEVERERDDDQGYVVNFHSCFYHNFLAANEAPELTPLFCDFDVGWISGIDPKRHGLRFERPTTIGHGGTMCPFRFLRVPSDSKA